MEMEVEDDRGKEGEQVKKQRTERKEKGERASNSNEAMKKKRGKKEKEQKGEAEEQVGGDGAPRGSPEFFKELKLSSHEYLETLPREKCPSCGVNRKYFCYECFRKMGDPSKTPSLKLPIKVDM
jgi:hypothetical protein